MRNLYLRQDLNRQMPKNRHFSKTRFLQNMTLDDIRRHYEARLDHILVIYVEYEADNTSYYDKYFSIIFADWGSHSSHTPLLS